MAELNSFYAFAAFAFLCLVGWWGVTTYARSGGIGGAAAQDWRKAIAHRCGLPLSLLMFAFVSHLLLWLLLPEAWEWYRIQHPNLFSVVMVMAGLGVPIMAIATGGWRKTIAIFLVVFTCFAIVYTLHYENATKSASAEAPVGRAALEAERARLCGEPRHFSAQPGGWSEEIVTPHGCDGAIRTDPAYGLENLEACYLIRANRDDNLIEEECGTGKEASYGELTVNRTEVQPTGNQTLYFVAVFTPKR